MAIDIAEIILEEFLKISPNLIANYSTVQDQLLYLILVPHVVLFLFLMAFSKGIVKRVIGDHPSFEMLMGIVAYLVIILGGWYGTFLVPVLLAWLYIGIILALGVFIMSIVIHPSRTPAIAKAFHEIGKTAVGKDKEKEAIEQEIQLLNAELMVVKRTIADPTASRQAKQFAMMQKHDIEMKIARLKQKLAQM